MQTKILLVALMAATIPSAVMGNKWLSGFVPNFPFFREVEEMIDPYENFNFFTKSLRQLTRFADQISNSLIMPVDSSKSNVTEKRLSLSGDAWRLRPRVDWQETHDGFVLTASTPGLSKEDLRVEVVEIGGQQYLEIFGQTSTKHREPSDESQPALLRQATYYNFDHRVRLPQGVDCKSLKAKYENGLLLVSMEHKEKENKDRRSITIE